MYSNCINEQFTIIGGQECTDYDDILQIGNRISNRDMTAIIPRLNFTCNGRITSIRARMWVDGTSNYPFFQVWRLMSVGSTIYNKVGEVPLQSDDPLSVVSDTTQITTINLTAGGNIIDVQSGDVVGYYHPSGAGFRVITRGTDGYILYQVRGASESVNLNFMGTDRRQPVIQFAIGKRVFNQTIVSC